MIKATAFEFRHRMVIIAVIYVMGFAMPWYLLSNAAGRGTWLTLSSLLARTGWLGLSEATIFVTVIALIAGAAGTLLRIWGTAHLGAGTMQSRAMVAGQVVASGPYRHVRNPLYLGSWLISIPIVLLMPLAGAVFASVALCVLYLRLIGGEEAHLAQRLGEAYAEYRLRVPRLVPMLLPAVPSEDTRPHWLRAIVAEFFPVSFTLCFAVLAWRYNAYLLMRCVVVCFGLSLVVRALSMPGRE